jgi:hypothetical protein
VKTQQGDEHLGGWVLEIIEKDIDTDPLTEDFGAEIRGGAGMWSALASLLGCEDW